MLRQLQQDFYAHIINVENSAILNAITPAINLEKRLSIYRGTIREKLRRALELTFPSLWQLVGKECADNVVYAFISETTWPTESVLDDWGIEFVNFIKTFEPLSYLVYLSDIMRLDWLKQLSEKSAEVNILSLKEFQQHFNEEPEAFKISLHPSVFLFQSPYSINDILDVLEGNQSEITLKPIASFAIVSRFNHDIVTIWITEPLFYFLTLLVTNDFLLNIFEKTLNYYPEFDMSNAMMFLLNNGLIIDHQAFDSAAMPSK